VATFYYYNPLERQLLYSDFSFGRDHAKMVFQKSILMLKKNLNVNPFELRNLAYPGFDIPLDEDVYPGSPGQPSGCEGQVAGSGHS